MSQGKPVMIEVEARPVCELHSCSETGRQFSIPMLSKAEKRRNKRYYRCPWPGCNNRKQRRLYPRYVLVYPDGTQVPADELV